MNPEDEIRTTFDDLADRVARDVASTEDPSLRTGPRLLGRPGLAIAGLVVIAGAGAAAIGLAGGDDDQQVATDSPTTTVTDDDAITGSTLDDGTPADDGSPTDPGDDTENDTADPAGEPAGDRFRVATELVSADADDPFLNVRGDPDARSDLVAKLPATYTGLRAVTGQPEVAEDGGSWLEVELLHPVAAAEFSLGPDRRPRGWVNQAFVEPLADGLPVGSDELAPCGIDAESFGSSGTLVDGHVAAMESAFVTDTCLRVVLTFGTGAAPFEWTNLPDGTGPATSVPSTVTLSSGGATSTIDLGPVASTWSEATDADADLYLARGDDGGLDLVVAARADVVGVTPRADIGAIVIDLEVDGPSPIPPADAGIVLTAPPLIGRGSIELTGLSRPFEALIGVELLDSSGQPVEAVFSGNAAMGTRRTTGYGAATNDWTEAWGRFALRIEGLAAGDYTLVLDADGVGENPERFRLDVTVDEGGEGPTLATEADTRTALGIADFARGADATQLELADEVTLLLGPEVQRVVPAEDLADRDAWIMEAPDGFAESTGPFSPLRSLVNPRLRITAGPIDHCAGPPRTWPTELDGLRQVNLEAVGIDSCIAWFGVHVFLDDEDRIAAVAYDLFGP